MPITSEQSSDALQGTSAASRWGLVAILSVIGMLNYGVRTSITAVFPLLKTDLGFTDVGLGALGSCFLWSYALASPFAGHLGDRFSRGRVVLLSLVGWSLVTAASGLANARWELLGVRILLGLVESLYLPAAMAFVGDYHSAKTVGVAMSILGMGQYVGLIGGATLAGFLGDRFGWRSSLWVLGAAGLVVALPAFILLPKGNPAAPGENKNAAAPDTNTGLSFIESASQLLRTPSFLVLAAAGALPSIGTWIFLNWLPLYFKESFGMSLAGAGFFGASFINASAAISTILGGLASDRVARTGEQNRMLLQGILILAAAPTLAAFVCTRNLAVIVAALVLNAGLRNAADLNILPLLCELGGKDRASIAFGITNMLNSLAGGVGVFVAGVLKASMGLTGVFAGIVGILVIDGVILFIGYSVFLKKDLQQASLRTACGSQQVSGHQL